MDIKYAEFGMCLCAQAQLDVRPADTIAIPTTQIYVSYRKAKDGRSCCVSLPDRSSHKPYTPTNEDKANNQRQQMFMFPFHVLA